MDYRETYRSWVESPCIDSDTKAELKSIRNDEKEIEERFYRELEFGTAGLRGIIGAGTNRMNRYVVQRATQGLAAYLLGIPGAAERGVCIACDSRRLSGEFAREAARVLAANGVAVYLFSTLHSVPQLSFTLQHLHCMAGIVITASHNPKQYNGYKVYWAYGGQCAPHQAAAIYGEMQKVPMFSAALCDYDGALESGKIRLIGPKEDKAYYEATEKLCLLPELLREKGPDLRLVYTPLFGTGEAPVMALLERVGVDNVDIVPEQAAPNSDFPGLKAPNPEDPAAFALAIRLAERTGATVCLATDPDADRLGIAVKTGQGDWITLTGNQIGCILLEHILSCKAAAGSLPENGVVIKSLVSTRLADAICQHYGVEMESVLTGFRFIGEKVDEYQRTGEKTFLFGFEESYGFLAGGLARDKDAVCSAMLAAEVCVDCRQKGITLYDMLRGIYARYGYYKEKVKSYTLEGKAGIEAIGGCMEALRQTPPASVAGVPVVTAEDYLLGEPSNNMLRYLLANNAWIVVRPSGTEPKLKLYIGANAPSEAEVDGVLQTLFTDIDGRLTRELHQ